MIWLITTLGLIGLTLLMGAPFVPSHKSDLIELFAELGQGNGQSFYDLGCGTGIVLVEAAKNGYIVYGYEVNPLFWIISKLRLRKYHSKIILKPWQFADLSAADVVYVFTGSIFAKSEKFKKISKEATILSMGFELSALSDRSSRSLGAFVIYQPKT